MNAECVIYCEQNNNNIENAVSMLDIGHLETAAFFLASTLTHYQGQR